jgi:hypothetical protein
MVKHWKFEAGGLTADGVAWHTSGEIEAVVTEVWERVMVHSFHALTNGKAIYGKPGVACKGPYEIKKVVVEQIDGHQR